MILRTKELLRNKNDRKGKINTRAWRPIFRKIFQKNWATHTHTEQHACVHTHTHTHTHTLQRRQRGKLERKDKIRRPKQEVQHSIKQQFKKNETGNRRGGSPQGKLSELTPPSAWKCPPHTMDKNRPTWGRVTLQLQETPRQREGSLSFQVSPNWLDTKNQWMGSDFSAATPQDNNGTELWNSLFTLHRF